MQALEKHENKEKLFEINVYGGAVHSFLFCNLLYCVNCFKRVFLITSFYLLQFDSKILIFVRFCNSVLTYFCSEKNFLRGNTDRHVVTTVVFNWSFAEP